MPKKQVLISVDEGDIPSLIAGICNLGISGIEVISGLEFCEVVALDSIDQEAYVDTISLEASPMCEMPFVPKGKRHPWKEKSYFGKY